MSRLLKFKKFLSIYEAATRIAQVLSEPVDVADVLRLALDGHLKLSIYLVNGSDGRLFQPVDDAANIEWSELPSLDGQRTLRLPVNGRLWVHSEKVYQLSRPVISLEAGIWDLPLVGGERVDVEHKLQQINFGPERTAVSLEGVLIQHPNGDIYEVQSRFPKAVIEQWKRKYDVSETFHPAGALPEDSEFVVRAESVEAFLALTQDSPQGVEKPLMPRERETLLNIIGVMLELLQTPKVGRNSDAAIIQEMIANYSDKRGISKRTLEEKFPAAKRSLTAE